METTKTTTKTKTTRTATPYDRVWLAQAVEFLQRLAAARGGASSGAFAVDVATALIDALACCPDLPAAEAWTVGAIAGAINVAATERDAPTPAGRRRSDQLAAMVACAPPTGFVSVARDVALLCFAAEVDATQIGAVVGRSNHPAAEAFMERVIDLALDAEKRVGASS